MINQPMHTIHLHGKLAEFGETHQLAVHTPAEAIRALSMQIKGFGDAMREGMFRLVRGADPDNGLHYETPYNPETNTYEVQMLHFSLGSSDETFHIVPVVAGAKSGGAGKAILGAVIMVVAVVGAAFTAGGSLSLAGVAAGMSSTAIGVAGFGVTWGGIAMFGAALMLGGISQMLQPSVKTNYGDNENPDQRASFFLGGQVNQNIQGGPVILAYGHIRTGSTVISAGLTPESM